MDSTSGMGVRRERGKRERGRRERGRWEKEIRYPVAPPPPRRGLWSSSRGRGGEGGEEAGKLWPEA